MPYDPNIHHRRSIRLKGFDYSQEGLYFVTICCYDRICLFGDIEDGQMFPNDAGRIVMKCWSAIPEHFPNAVLHEFVVMPNHVHGIIELKQNDNVVGSEYFLTLQQKHEPQQHEFQKMIPRSVASIVKGFKIGVTKWMRANTDIHNVWQRNYYEHIIRNQHSYETISDYIRNNPAKWNVDKFRNKR